jgi:hypothetical protein
LNNDVPSAIPEKDKSRDSNQGTNEDKNSENECGEQNLKVNKILRRPWKYGTPPIFLGPWVKRLSKFFTHANTHRLVNIALVQFLLQGLASISRSARPRQ